MRTDTDLSAELDAKPSGNVLTFLPNVVLPKSLPDQEHTGNRQTLRRAAPTISVKGSNTARRGKPKRRGARRKRGPKGSTALRWAVVEQIFALAYLARSAGLIPIFVTIRAPKGEPAAKGRRFIAKRLGHLGQSLQRDIRSRKGQPHIGMTVYEIAPDEGHLHAHHIVYLTNRADMKIVARWAEVFEPRRTGTRHDVTIHARPACSTDIAYMTKQRLPLSPDFEANTMHRRKPGGFIPGPRWALTKHFRAMAGLERSEGPPSVQPLIEARREVA